MIETPVVSIVDDDESIRQALDGLLRSAGLAAAAFGSVEEFLRSEQLATTGCLILDLRMPGIDGLQLQQWLRAEGHRVPIIVLTAHGDDGARNRALAAGALAFLCKPFDADVLLGAVGAALGPR